MRTILSRAANSSLTHLNTALLLLITRRPALVDNNFPSLQLTAASEGVSVLLRKHPHRDINQLYSCSHTTFATPI